MLQMRDDIASYIEDDFQTDSSQLERASIHSLFTQRLDLSKLQLEEISEDNERTTLQVGYPLYCY